jgi:16S rRNA (adenine1518-N6/adenine1519-N6)-dimethyltransferase
MTIRPAAKKSLGQNFLVDPSYCDRITRFAGVKPLDHVVEIGPGTGALTSSLLRCGASVFAIEFDREMVDYLNRELLPGAGPDLTIHFADVLRFDWMDLSAWSPFKIVGNLPYNIATRIVRDLASFTSLFESFSFMVQKEVAQRILARPCNKDYGFLTLLAEYHFTRVPGFDVPPGAFRPSPQVTSHVMKLIPRSESPDPVGDYQEFVSLVARAFAQRRKTLWNNLAGGVGRERLTEAFEKAGIERNKRPEEVSLSQYSCLARML